MYRNLTDNEVKVLRAIVKSHEHDGKSPIGHGVWTSSVNPFVNKHSLSGVNASLAKKGLIEVHRESLGWGSRFSESVVSITQAGFDALKLHESQLSLPAMASNQKVA